MFVLGRVGRMLRSVTAARFGHEPYTLADKKKIVYRDDKTGYYIHPEEAVHRLLRVVMSHPSIKVKEATLNMTWNDLGLNELDVCEVIFALENEFRIEMPCDQIEKFSCLRDAMEYVSRSFFSG